jgi:4'-phosphopantetheinyl transferase
LPPNDEEVCDRMHMFQLPPCHVEVWTILFDPAHSSSQDARDCLSESELAHAERFRFAEHRQFYVFSHVVLRRLLARYTGLEPGEISFASGPLGKPYLPHFPQIKFNASHSGNVYLCAVANGVEIGADVEKIEPLKDMESIARHFFAPTEQRALFQLSKPERTRGFYECWTRKEAVIKCTGEGITRRLDSFEVAFGPNIEPKLLRLDQVQEPPWQVASFDPHPGYIAAIASPHGWNDISFRDFAVHQR